MARSNPKCSPYVLLSSHKMATQTTSKSTTVMAVIQEPEGEYQRWSIKVKKEFYLAWLACEIPEAADIYSHKWNAALAVADAKTRVWEEFRETMGQVFQLVVKQFWQTVRWFRRGKRCPFPFLLLQLRIRQWKKHFQLTHSHFCNGSRGYEVCNSLSIQFS